MDLEAELVRNCWVYFECRGSEMLGLKEGYKKKATRKHNKDGANIN
jgi:hypothetical protein